MSLVNYIKEAYSILYKLYHARLFSFRGIFVLCKAILKHGVNLFALLQFASKLTPSQLAIQDHLEKYSYQSLYTKSLMLAKQLHVLGFVFCGAKVAFLCKNHTMNVLSLFACSRLGAHVTLLNIEMSKPQIENIIHQKKFNILFADHDLWSGGITNCRVMNFYKCNHSHISVQELLECPPVHIILKKYRTGNINVLTGGTSGKIKLTQRKPSLVRFMAPFLALLHSLDLHQYHSVYIAVPIYHGYGLASLLMSVLLRAKIFILPKYITATSLDLIRDHKIEIVVLVPLMLRRMLSSDLEMLDSVKKILSGGAMLDPSLIRQTLNQLGFVLFNLYGTSEAGFSVLATPQCMQKYPQTIGKRIRGVSLRIYGTSGKKVGVGEIGVLQIKSAWSVRSSKNQYISTGDLACMNAEKYIFLKGREDDMIVSGGENVYPQEITSKLIEHQHIEEAVVVAVEDMEFGKRLVAFVIIHDNKVTVNEIIIWLRQRIARYQMPTKILTRDAFPITNTGKISKTQLIASINSSHDLS